MRADEKRDRLALSLDDWPVIGPPIVEDHQGRIDVTSAVGKGTTFAVVLPLQRAAMPTATS